MIKKKLSRKRVDTNASSHTDIHKTHLAATKQVYDKFQKNPDTSVYSKKFKHKQTMEE